MAKDKTQDLASEIAALKNMSKSQSTMVQHATNDLDALRTAIQRATMLEEKQIDLVKKGSTDLAMKMRHRIEQNQKIIEANAGFMDIINIEGKIREETAADLLTAQDKILDSHAEALEMNDAHNDAIDKSTRELFTLGDRTSMLGKASQALDDKFNTLKDSSGMLGSFFDSMGTSTRKIALSMTASAGLLTSVSSKYANSLLESSTFLPEAIQGAGLIESSMFMGKMMLDSGLTLEQLTAQMKGNRVAWQNNGKQITKFISDNELLRMKMGETREGFAEAAARASGFLTAQGVEQKDLSKATGKYLMNLNAVSIQTDRQASEIEGSRRSALKDSGNFLMQFGGDTRKSMNAMVKLLDDQLNGNNGVAQLMMNAFQEGDVNERLANANEASRSLRDIGERAGVSAEKMDDLLLSQQKAIMGDADAAKRLAVLSEEIGNTINAYAENGAIYDKAVGGPLDDFGKILGDAANAASNARDADGNLQSEKNKAAKVAGKALSNEVESAFGGFLATLSSFRAKLGAVGGDITTTLMGFGAALPGFIELGRLIPGMGGSMNEFTSDMKKNNKKSRGMFGKSGGMIAKFIGFLGPLGLALGAIAIIAPLVMEHWDEIVDFLKMAGSEIGKVFDKLVGTFTNMFPDTSAFLNEWIITPITDFFGSIFGGEKSGDPLQDWVLTPISNYFKLLFAGALAIGSFLQDNLITPVMGFFGSIFTGEDTGNKFQDWVLTPVSNYFKLLFAGALAIGSFLQDNLITPVTQFFSGIMDSDFSFSELFQTLIIDPIKNFIGSIGDMISNFTSISTLKNMLPSWASGLFGDDEDITPEKKQSGSTFTNLFGSDEPTKKPEPEPQKEYVTPTDTLVSNRDQAQAVADKMPDGVAKDAMLQTVASLTTQLEKRQPVTPPQAVDIPMSESPQIAIDSSPNQLPQSTDVVEPITQSIEVVEPITQSTDVAQSTVAEPITQSTDVAQSTVAEPITQSTDVAQSTVAEPITQSIEVVEPITQSTDVAQSTVAEPNLTPAQAQLIPTNNVIEPISNNKPISIIKRLEADIQTTKVREATLKSSQESKDPMIQSEMAGLRIDRAILQGMLEELKKITASTRTSVVLQDSMNGKQDKLIRK